MAETEAGVAAFTIWRGTCGHVWDRRVEDTDECYRCALEADARARHQLERLQWDRWQESIAKWQKAHPDVPNVELTWPDLGALFVWLLEGEGLLARWLEASLSGDPIGLFDLPTETANHLGLNEDSSDKRPTEEAT